MSESYVDEKNKNVTLRVDIDQLWRRVNKLEEQKNS